MREPTALISNDGGIMGAYYSFLKRKEIERDFLGLFKRKGLDAYLER